MAWQEAQAGETRMSWFEIGSSAFGVVLIAVTIWQIVKNGIARSNGKIPEQENVWLAPPPSP